MTFIYDAYGIPRQLEDLSTVTRLAELKKKSGMDPWPVIEACFNIWTAKNPKKWESYVFYLKDIKETRKLTSVGNKLFSGVSKDNEQGGYISYACDLPQPVQLMIRCIYSPDELPMDKDFFQEYARRFPKFVVREAKN